MKKEIKGKEYNIKKITWKDFGDFSDYLLDEKLKAFSRYANSMKLDKVELTNDLRDALRQIGLTTDIKMDVLKNFESALMNIQSKQNGIMKILSEPMTHSEVQYQMFSPKGMFFMIWLAIRDNGINFEDMESIIDGANILEVFNFVEVVGIKQQVSEEDKKKKKEVPVENPSLSGNANLPIVDITE